jgi:hypothetical protein
VVAATQSNSVPRFPAIAKKNQARCSQQGKSVDPAFAWAADELEGFMSG